MSTLSQVTTLQLLIWTMMLPPSPETSSLIKRGCVWVEVGRKKGRYNGKLLAVLIGHTGPLEANQGNTFSPGRASERWRAVALRGTAGYSDFSK